MEKGKHRLHSETLARLARILKVSADELLGLETKERRTAGPPQLPERDQRAGACVISSIVASQVDR